MRTRVAPPDPRVIRMAGAILRSGGLVAFPTETVYGLGASALDAGAMAGIYAVKGRPSDNPLIVHVADLQAARRLARVRPVAARLAEAFWPGPLTLVLKRWTGKGTVAVRSPDHAVARAILLEAGRPVAAPSANRSGRPSPTTAEAVKAELDGLISLVVDGGPCAVGLESTVVDATSDDLAILRPGAIAEEDLVARGFGVSVAPPLAGGMPRSPGQKYRHYSPRIPLVAIRQGVGADAMACRWARALLDRGRRPGVVGIGDALRGAWPSRCFDNDRAMAAGLFSAFRELEDRVDMIVVVAPAEEGIGRAVVNRLEKAAGGRVFAAAPDLEMPFDDLGEKA